MNMSKEVAVFMTPGELILALTSVRITLGTVKPGFHRNALVKLEERLDKQLNGVLRGEGEGK